MNDNSNDDINMMAKYFIHSSQNQSQNPNDNSEINNLNNLMNKEIINNKNINQNINNLNTNMNSMNTSFESTMTNQMNLNNEIMNDLMGVGADFQDKKLIKLIRTFKKNIKLRNATIKKNFWKRDYINNKLINIKISSLFPILEPTQGFCLCLYNYMNNKQFKELICKVENEIIVNKLNDNINNLIEKYTVINQEENQLNNLLINPIAYIDNNKHRKELIKLISSIYYRIKSLKIELGKSKENYIFNYLVIKSKLINNNKNAPPFIYGKLYSIFPNINFQLHEINKLSLSSKFKLNKLLISKRHINIQNEKGIQLTNGFITMSNEKRIITLTDDTNKKELQESQSLKQIIFGIWLSLKYEDVSTYENIEVLISKHKHFIYRKCLEFVLASPKIETIFSPSPDEGIFLLIIFFKTSQCYFEVKIIPNEEDKNFIDEYNNNNEFKILENFNNQWLIRTQKFDLCNNNGQFFFNFQPYLNRNKYETVNDFINSHLNNKKKSEKNIDNLNNYNNININNMNNINNINNINNMNVLKNNFNTSNNNNNYYNSNYNNNVNMNNNFYNNNTYNNLGYNLNNNFEQNKINNNNNIINNNQNENINRNNNYSNNQVNNDINNNKINNNLNNEINNQYINTVNNNNFNNSNNSGFGMSSQGNKDSKNHKETPNRIFRSSHSQKKIENIPHKENNINNNNKEIFDPLTDIFEHNNNNNDYNTGSNPSSNKYIPYVKNKNYQQNQNQNIYNTNYNNPKTSYNPNEYLKMGQANNNRQVYSQEIEENINENKGVSPHESKKNLINENNKILNNIGSVYGDINDENWLSQSNFGGLNLPINNQNNNNNQDLNMNRLMNMQNNKNNMFGGQIMMNNNINNNINILNNINNNNSNNNNMSNRERDEISQQSNTNYSQYTLGKKVYSNNCSNNDSAKSNKNQDFNININNSNKNLNKLILKNNSNEIMTHNNLINNNLENNDNNLNLEENKNKIMTPKMSNYNKYSQDIMGEQPILNISKKNNYSNEKNLYYSNKNINNTYHHYNSFNQNEIIIQKEDKATQTINEEKTNLNNNSQIQNLNIIITEQSKSIQSLQNKVNNLEELLAKVNLLLKRKNEKEKEKEKNDELEISNDNNDNENDYSFNNKSESLKNSGNNSKENLNNNLSNNIKGNESNININNNNKINEEVSNDNIYKIKNTSNLIDSNNKLIVGGNKNILANEESLDNDLSSDLNISDSRNSKELNKSGNIGDKTIEIPKIKYNSTLLNSNNDETENDISSN